MSPTVSILYILSTMCKYRTAQKKTGQYRTGQGRTVAFCGVVELNTVATDPYPFPRLYYFSKQYFNTRFLNLIIDIL